MVVIDSKYAPLYTFTRRNWRRQQAGELLLVRIPLRLALSLHSQARRVKDFEWESIRVCCNSDITPVTHLSIFLSWWGDWKQNQTVRYWSASLHREVGSTNQRRERCKEANTSMDHGTLAELKIEDNLLNLLNRSKAIKRSLWALRSATVKHSIEDALQDGYADLVHGAI